MRENYIFIDESGDLGIKGSRYFVIAGIIVRNEKELERIVKRTRERIIKKKLKQMPELKANKCSEKVRKYLLKKLGEKDIRIFAIVVDKHKVFSYLFNVKEKFYNFLSRILIEKIGVKEGKIKIVMDKRYKKNSLRKKLSSYLKNFLENKYPNLIVEVSQVSSHSCKPLQVSDFVAWCIHRKYEFNDESYYNLIRDKVINRDNMELWK